jgi:ethanolamine utilization protein EutN
MNLGRVTGRIVATIRYPGLEGVKLLLLQPLDERLAPRGAPLVACDTVHSGIGDVVTWIGGREATYPLPVQFVPVDATIVGHVEQVAT